MSKAIRPGKSIRPDTETAAGQHGVGLSDGVPFGAPKGHYVRLNFGCTRATLTAALHRMKAALASR